MTLPKQFQPNGTYDLIRLGKDHDGGYLVDPTSVAKAEQLISFGLSTDWSFEKEFCARNNVPLLAYDGTISVKILVKHIAKYFWHFKLRRLITSVFLLADYFRFFKHPRIHRHLNVGYDSQKSVSLQTILRQESPPFPIFIKMDIESWEYRVLDDVLKYASNISGLVVEFHDVDLHRKKVLNFLAAFPLTLIHVHSNNCGQLVDASGDPITLEMTFSAYPEQMSSQPSIPHSLDQVNCRREKSLPLKFE